MPHTKNQSRVRLPTAPRTRSSTRAPSASMRRRAFRSSAAVPSGALQEAISANDTTAECLVSTATRVLSTAVGSDELYLLCARMLSQFGGLCDALEEERSRCDSLEAELQHALQSSHVVSSLQRENHALQSRCAALERTVASLREALSRSEKTSKRAASKYQAATLEIDQLHETLNQTISQYRAVALDRDQLSRTVRSIASCATSMSLSAAQPRVPRTPPPPVMPFGTASSSSAKEDCAATTSALSSAATSPTRGGLSAPVATQTVAASRPHVPPLRLPAGTHAGARAANSSPTGGLPCCTSTESVDVLPVQSNHTTESLYTRIMRESPPRNKQPNPFDCSMDGDNNEPFASGNLAGGLSLRSRPGSGSTLDELGLQGSGNAGLLSTPAVNLRSSTDDATAAGLFNPPTSPYTLLPGAGPLPLRRSRSHSNPRRSNRQPGAERPARRRYLSAGAPATRTRRAIRAAATTDDFDAAIAAGPPFAADRLPPDIVAETEQPAQQPARTQSRASRPVSTGNMNLLPAWVQHRNP